MTARTRILWSAGVLALVAIALPVRLPDPLAGSASSECLTLPDTPPDLSRTDRIPVYERCSRLDPTDVEVMADLGSLYEAAGRAKDAEAVYQRALDVDPGYADLRLRLGRLLLKRGETRSAAHQAETALMTQPNRQALLQLLHAARGE
jgi:tetratricopeptide (TPR) repeat protein